MTAKARLALLTLGFLAVNWGLVAVATPHNQTLPYGEISWSRGLVRISAVGLPPFDPAGKPVDPAIARANAVATAQKRLLAVLLQLELPKGGTLRQRLDKHPELKGRLRELITAAAVEGKTYSDGAVEVTLTVALKGAHGVMGIAEGP